MSAVEYINKTELDKGLYERFHDEDAPNNITEVALGSVRKYVKGFEPANVIECSKLDGLAEGIRCAMCTNPMKSDRGCDGSCVVNESMYKSVMKVIDEQLGIKE